MSPLNWYLYILECADGSLYTGVTTDVDRRLEAHRSGKGAKYTRSHRPLKLVYWETVGDRAAALRREAAVKKLSRAEKLALIAAGGVPAAGKTADPDTQEAL